ncbi:MAG TPA: PKD domain-containing protein, partial [Flavobacteriales bacterium]|nr:PKD domain-containing protein [Flavobacteriales bacterium]
MLIVCGATISLSIILIYQVLPLPTLLWLIFLPTPLPFVKVNQLILQTKAAIVQNSWSWTFQGGSPSSSNSQNLTVTYNTAGTYNVTLMVSNSGGSDTKTSNSYITVNPSPAASVSSTDASCNSACDGSGSLIASGGTTPYTYYWNTNPTQNNATSTGLCAGTYNYSVSGANGCNSTGTVTIAEPSAISLSLTTTDAACGTADGTASVSAAGGSAPFSYQWDDPANQNTSTATGLTAGIYSVTVTDANGCSTSSSISVDNQGGPSISTTSQDVICNGDTHGQATVIPTGGTPPYTYSWNTATPQVAATATGLAAGTYSIIVTDASGCIVSDFVTISEPAALNLAMAYTNVSSPGICDGQASANVSGGTPPFAYLWNDSLSQVTAT